MNFQEPEYLLNEPWCFAIVSYKMKRKGEVYRANKITANAGERLGFAGKSRVGLSPRPGVAEFHR
jgi:hypothetical protein